MSTRRPRSHTVSPPRMFGRYSNCVPRSVHRWMGAHWSGSRVRIRTVMRARYRSCGMVQDLVRRVRSIAALRAGADLHQRHCESFCWQPVLIFKADLSRAVAGLQRVRSVISRSIGLPDRGSHRTFACIRTCRQSRPRGTHHTAPTLWSLAGVGGRTAQGMSTRRFAGCTATGTMATATTSAQSSNTPRALSRRTGMFRCKSVKPMNPTSSATSANRWRRTSLPSAL